MRLFLICCVLFLVNCQMAKLGKVEKHIIKPGQPTGRIIIKYNAQLLANKSLTIQSVSLSNYDNKISNFVIIDLNNGMLMKSGQLLSKGAYFIEFKADFNEKFRTSEDTITIRVKSGNKESAVSEVVSLQ